MTDPVPLTGDLWELTSHLRVTHGRQRRTFRRPDGCVTCHVDYPCAVTQLLDRLATLDRDRSTPSVEHEPTPVQYDAGCTEHDGRTDLHCATCGHPLDRSTPSFDGLRELRAELDAADEPAYRHVMQGSIVKERVLAGTILPDWLRLRLLDALAVTPTPARDPDMDYERRDAMLDVAFRPTPTPEHEPTRNDGPWYRGPHTPSVDGLRKACDIDGRHSHLHQHDGPHLLCAATPTPAAEPRD